MGALESASAVFSRRISVVGRLNRGDRRVFAEVAELILNTSALGVPLPRAQECVRDAVVPTESVFIKKYPGVPHSERGRR